MSMTKSNGNAVGAYTGGANPYASAADDLGAADGVFMKFNGNNGDFTAGSQGDEIPHETRLAARMDGFARGWICWVDGEVVDEVMVPVLEGKPPAESELEDHGPYKKHDDGTEDGWTEQAKLVFTTLDTGENLTFKTSSGSGLRALGNLSRDYGRQMRAHPDEMPVVELGVNEFVPRNNKKVGKKYAPIFKIVEWISAEELDEIADNAGTGEDDSANYEGAAEQEQQQAPAQTQKADEPEKEQRQQRVAPQQQAGEQQQRGRRAAGRFG